MATQVREQQETGTSVDPVQRSRWGIVALALAVTSAIALVGVVLWPTPSKGNWWSYGDIAPIRDRWWGVVTLLAVCLVINVPCQALAALALVRRRGSRWATSGAVVMWLGAAMQAAGAAGWAMTYYFATDPKLDPAAGTALLKRVDTDPHMFVVAMAGTLMVALGTSAQAAGLWRSHAVPRWLPIASLAVVASFFLPEGGPLGLIAEVPLAVSSVAIGYYAWRRAG
jgi:hypothetical protein